MSVVSVLVVACSGSNNQMGSPRVEGAAAEAVESQEPQATERAAVETVEAPPVEAPTVEAPSSAESTVTEESPKVCSTFMFDLRSMPHTGPYQVDEESIRARYSALMQRVVEAAGTPAAEILTQAGRANIARFSGPNAMDQCERVRGVVTPPPPPTKRRRRPRFNEERSTPCEPCP